MMKRSREDGDHQVEALAMANCLMLLSRVGKSAALPASRVFTCKTCNREFSSFQALGGHRASHKKPFRLMSGDHLHVQTPSSPPKPKTHECSICGLNFTIGQALGGHMRRHRAPAVSDSSTVTSSQSAEIFDKTTISCSSNKKRVLSLDLNLTPYENDLNLVRAAPWLQIA
uniref:Transcription factor ZAT2 n=1 Tax=Diospyros kaki TaxID=35925 RepID=A0A3S8T9B5_DIOKA|nr:transcription factor ZAT2 [Diospyros kaki]